MVRRRSTVRFRKEALERKHEKYHPPHQARSRSGGVLAFPAVYGLCRSPTGACAEYVPKFSAVAGVAEGFLNAARRLAMASCPSRHLAEILSRMTTL